MAQPHRNCVSAHYECNSSEYQRFHFKKGAVCDARCLPIKKLSFHSAPILHLAVEDQRRSVILATTGNRDERQFKHFVVHIRGVVAWVG